MDVIITTATPSTTQSPESTLPTTSAEISSTQSTPVMTHPPTSALTSDPTSTLTSDLTSVLTSDPTSVLTSDDTSVFTSDGTSVMTSDPTSVLSSDLTSLLTADLTPAVTSDHTSSLTSDSSSTLTSISTSYLPSDPSSPLTLTSDPDWTSISTSQSVDKTSLESVSSIVHTNQVGSFVTGSSTSAKAVLESSEQTISSNSIHSNLGGTSSTLVTESTSSLVDAATNQISSVQPGNSNTTDSNYHVVTSVLPQSFQYEGRTTLLEYTNKMNPSQNWITLATDPTKSLGPRNSQPSASVTETKRPPITAAVTFSQGHVITQPNDSAPQMVLVYSDPDQRVSAKVIGSFAIIMLSTSFFFLILVDIPEYRRDLKKMRSNIKDFLSRM